MALSLALLMVSCSATRSASPSPPSLQELSHLALVIQESPDGQVSHSWEPLSSFDLSKYPSRARNSRLEGPPLAHVAWTRSCEDEFDACVDMCMKSLRGRNWRHASRGSRAEICRDRCRPAYNDCCRLRDQAEALEFSAVDDAVGWLKQHREEVLVGTLVVIAGVAFVAVAVGSGGSALLLMPTVLLVSPDVPSEPRIAVMNP